MYMEVGSMMGSVWFGGFVCLFPSLGEQLVPNSTEREGFLPASKGVRFSFGLVMAHIVAIP